MAGNKADDKPSLKSKLEKEGERKTRKDWEEIRLYREGTFFHAFNQSAWLLSQFVYNEDYWKRLGEKHGLQVVHTMVRQGCDYLVAGFPTRSVDKYLGACEQEYENDVLTAAVPPALMPVGKPEECQKQYEEFAAAIPAKEPKPRKGSSAEVAATGQDGRSGMLEIVRQVMAFRLEESNPMDAMNFVARLKAMAGSLL